MAKKKWQTIFNLSNHLETYFYWHGHFCARHPKLVIIVSFSLTIIASLGLFNFHWESNAIKLWIPKNSDFIRNYDFLWTKYPPDMRFHSVLFVADDNILKPKYIQQMYQTYKEIQRIQINNKTWDDFCFRLPVVKIDIGSFFGLGTTTRSKRSVADESGDQWFESNDGSFFSDDDSQFKEFDPSISYYPSPYCGVVEAMPTSCFESTILELWANNGRFDEKSDKMIQTLTEEQILNKINTQNTSGLFLIERDFISMLGGVQRDPATGRVVSAKATQFQLVGKMNGTAAKLEGVDIDNALGEWVDKSTLEFEEALIKTLMKTNEENKINKTTDGSTPMETFIFVARSFSDLATENIFSDVSMVLIGFGIVFLYVIILLGKLSHVENRVYLSLVGLMSVGMSLPASYGICCSLGFAFSPLHNFIPFLLLGLGIDDMFVIMQAWKNSEAKGKLDPNGAQLKLPERFGKAMSHAGVGITVTSLTDVIAFTVGASTILPALRSFCLFCGLGIFIIYVLQSTWFVAWMVIDQRRIEANRNGLCPCYKHTKTLVEPNTGKSSHFVASQKLPKLGILKNENLGGLCFRIYGQILTFLPIKILVICFSLILLGLSIWGNVLLRQEFDPMWFLPKDSYLSLYVQQNDRYFPSQGEKTHIFGTELDFPDELIKVDNLINRLESQKDIITHVDDWYRPFKKYYEKHFKEEKGVDLNQLDYVSFAEIMARFLFSQNGSRFRFLFRYDGQIICGKPSPRITMFTFEFAHRLFSGPSEQVPAMNRVKSLIRSQNFSGNVFPFSKGYAAWETDEVIADELYRNIFLAFMCILFTTLLLLFDVLACVFVLIAVANTIVNVAGFMHFWGLTIETVSCTNLIICIGLCVDCAAHIAHQFLTEKGHRDERVRKCLIHMGPAVLNGGFSTFLSIALLCNSNSHVFITFFKIFFLVVVFALYNGLVLLPVLLSLYGPPSKKVISFGESNIKDIALQDLTVELGGENERESCLPQSDSVHT